MANFYNPFQKGPDYGAGASDIASQVLQMLMMKKMFPAGKQELGQTPLPQQGPMGQAGMGANAQALMSGAGQGAAGQDFNLANDPQMSDIIKRILAGLPGVMGR